MKSTLAATALTRARARLHRAFATARHRDEVCADEAGHRVDVAADIVRARRAAARLAVAATAYAHAHATYARAHAEDYPAAHAAALTTI